MPLMLYSNVLSIEDAQEIYPLHDYLEIANNSSLISSFERVIKEGTFQTYNPNQILQSQQTYWSKFTIENRLSNGLEYPEWVIVFSFIFTDIQVYAIDEQGQIQTARSGFFVPPAQRTYAPTLKGNLIKLSLLPNKTYTVYIKTDCDRIGMEQTFDMSILSHSKHQDDLRSKTQYIAVYIGFVLMMLGYNLIIYFFAKDPTYIYYSIYLGCIALYTAHNAGDLANWVIPYLSPETPTNYYYFKLLVYIAFISYLFFVRTFLDLKQLLPTWDKMFKWLILISIPWAMIDTWAMTSSNFNYDFADTFVNTYALLFVICTFSFVYPLAKTKDSKGQFINFGVIAMGIGILITTWARIQTIEFSTFAFKIGSIIEITAFSLGLSFQQIQNEKERQKVKYALAKSQLIQEQEKKEAERLKELDSLKSKLYTNITHEFKTPLTVIMGMAGEIKKQSKIKELIQRNSTNLLQLINQLLDLAKAEEGKLTLNFVYSDIIKYIQYLTESFLSAAESKNIRLVFYAEEEEFWMDFDEDKIKHIIQNLLSNALKFTPNNGMIILHLKVIQEENQTNLQLLIKDSGIGIKKTDLPYIFDRFYQSDASSTRQREGTGIGLALTKELVSLMEGTINVHSTINQGSEFKIVLPVRQHTNQQKIEAPALIKEQYVAAPILMDETPISKTPLDEKPILLLVEDNPDVVIYIQQCLQDTYNLQFALNGAEGIEKAVALIPDIIISDVMMPKKNGFDVTRILKTDERTSHIPIIILTAKSTQSDRLKGLEYGADAYLLKPFDKKELLIRLEKLIELRRRLQTYYGKTDFIAPKANKAAELPKNKMVQSEIAFLKKLQQFIEDNLEGANFSMPHLAQTLQMSQVQVYRKIKSLTNQTPTQYIRTRRLAKAIHLLQSTELNISEIAYQTGFSDPNYFSRTFHKEFGKTPSSYR